MEEPFPSIPETILMKFFIILLSLFFLNCKDNDAPLLIKESQRSLFDGLNPCASEKCEFILESNKSIDKELKKIKKGSKEYFKALDLAKSKMNIQRFKGLGEMNPEELWSTTLDPETRNLLQVQYSKDLKKDQNLIHTLMGNDVALRKDFIVSNAINVRDLDI